MAGRATGKNAEEGRCEDVAETTDGEVTGVKIEELIMALYQHRSVGARLAEAPELTALQAYEREVRSFATGKRGEGGSRPG